MPPTLSELIEMRTAVADAPVTREKLAERFLLPPFSVLDARQGYWQKRKRAWIDLGIQSELGRGENYNDNGSLGFSEQSRSHYRKDAPGGSTMPAGKIGADGKTRRGDARGRLFANDATFHSGPPDKLYHAYGESSDAAKKIVDAQPQSGTSIFDPVLCELAYRWFCPPGGSVLDPFAGGSVRGIVAAMLGRKYAGIDLRPEQEAANYTQKDTLCPMTNLRWEIGDAQEVTTLLPGEYDFIFSCPPYADLEKYSDDPRDLSTMEYPQFLDAYRRIITASCSMLRQDRFACFVVGDLRDRVTGNYRNFPGDTIEAFRAAGLELYNEAILVTSAGSLPIRVGYQFTHYRKLGKTHQNVLVFLKGNAGRTSAACGEVDVDDLEMPEYVEDSVAICRQDAKGTLLEHWLIGTEQDVAHIYLPLLESYLVCDIVRGRARIDSSPPPRVWIGVGGQWMRIPDSEDFTYIVSGKVYLNRKVFPNAPVPPFAKPVTRKLRGT